jgi:hypothetical protein
MSSVRTAALLVVIFGSVASARADSEQAPAAEVALPFEEGVKMNVPGLARLSKQMRFLSRHPDRAEKTLGPGITIERLPDSRAIEHTYVAKDMKPVQGIGSQDGPGRNVLRKDTADGRAYFTSTNARGQRLRVNMAAPLPGERPLFADTAFEPPQGTQAQHFLFKQGGKPVAQLTINHMWIGERGQVDGYNGMSFTRIRPALAPVKTVAKTPRR